VKIQLAAMAAAGSCSGMESLIGTDLDVDVIMPIDSTNFVLAGKFTHTHSIDGFGS